jgi:hypothetical protein
MVAYKTPTEKQKISHVVYKTPTEKQKNITRSLIKLQQKTKKYHTVAYKTPTEKQKISHCRLLEFNKRPCDIFYFPVGVIYATV